MSLFPDKSGKMSFSITKTGKLSNRKLGKGRFLSRKLRNDRFCQQNWEDVAEQENGILCWERNEIQY